MKTLTITDLVLHAASLCHFCRMGNRPKDFSDQEHGDSFSHVLSPNSAIKECAADQIWVLIRRLENSDVR